MLEAATRHSSPGADPKEYAWPVVLRRHLLPRVTPPSGVTDRRVA